MDNEIIKQYAKYLGSKGGNATKNKKGKDYYSEIGKKGMASRWNKSKENK